MPLTTVESFAGIANGVPINAANLNAALRDPLQANTVAFAQAAAKMPLLWDVTSQAPNVTVVNSLNPGNIPPGIVFIDLSDSDLAAGADVEIGLQDSAEGCYLFLPFDKNESPDARIFISTPAGYTVNNTVPANLPDGGFRFKINNGGATLVGKMANPNRLICKDGWHFRAIIEELEDPDNLAILNQLADAGAQWAALQTTLQNNYTSLIFPSRDNQADTLLANLDGNREDMMQDIYRFLQTNTAGAALWPKAKVETLTDLTTDFVSHDLIVDHDCFRYVFIVPPTAQVKKMFFNLKYPADWPEDVFENIMISVGIACRRAIPFNVNLNPLNFDGQDHRFQSDQEEVIIYRKSGTAGLLLP